MSDSPRIVVLPGDGIGPEIVAAARRLLESLGEFEFEELLMGGCSIDAHGTALTDEVLASCRAADAVLLGAVGGPKWDTTDPDAPRPEQGLLGLRKGMGLYANLRPVRPSPALVGASPLREERIAGTDLLVVRELTGGIYFGASGRDGDSAHDTCEYDAGEIERIARTGFRGRPPPRRELRPLAPRVTSVDKANVLETSRLWREVVTGIAPDYADVALDHLLVDNAAMQLVSRPAEFDVIVTENLFGDILSDESAMLTGSLGMLPSASLGADGAPGLFEPVHGSAPDIAGKGIANPLATFLSVAMMLRHGLDRPDDATRIEAAVDTVLESGLRTPDLAAGTLAKPPMPDVPAEVEVGTAEMTDAVLAASPLTSYGAVTAQTALDEVVRFAFFERRQEAEAEAVVGAGVDRQRRFRGRAGDVDAELAGSRLRRGAAAAQSGAGRAGGAGQHHVRGRGRLQRSLERFRGAVAGRFRAFRRTADVEDAAQRLPALQRRHDRAEFFAQLRRRHRAVGDDRFGHGTRGQFVRGDGFAVSLLVVMTPFLIELAITAPPPILALVTAPLPMLPGSTELGPSLPATTAFGASLPLVTAAFFSFAAVTAPRLSCLVPTLFLGSPAATAAPPSAMNRAIVAMTLE